MISFPPSPQSCGITIPDVVAGYNSNEFDFPYLLERAKQLRVDPAGWKGWQLMLPPQDRQLH